jgi:hypothetical protein
MDVYFPQTTVLPTMRTPEAMRIQGSASEIRDNMMVRAYIRYALHSPGLSSDEMDGLKVGRAIEGFEYVVIQGNMRKQTRNADAFRFRAIRPIEGGAWCVQAGCRLFTFHHWLMRAQGSCTGGARRTYREEEPDYQRVTMEVLDKLMDLCMAYDMKTGKFPKFE